MIDLYKTALSINENVKHTGFNYSGDKLLRKSMSPYMFQNEILYTFVDLVSTMLANNIDAVKKIRIHNNFAVDKDSTYIN